MPLQINTYQEKFKIRAYEIGLDANATVITISNFLQEIAGNHAGQLGLSVDKLFVKKLTWVLSRLHLKIDSYPKWREEISIVTWPSGVYGKYATRDFEIINSKNQIIGKATTSWMLIDLNKMKPITMPEFITSIELPEKDRAIYDKFEKIPKINEIHHLKKYNVRLSDLDLNQHVNNVSYIEWAVETVPVQVSQKMHLEKLEISFRAESKYGDSIKSNSSLIEDGYKKIYLHSLLNVKTETEIAAARTYWIKK